MADDNEEIWNDRPADGKDVWNTIPADRSGIRKLGFSGWVLFGFLGGCTGIALTVLVGYTDNLLLIGLTAPVVGILTGLGVRLGAGVSRGFRPGSVAACIALLCIFAGRVGAFYFSTENLFVFGGKTQEDILASRIGFETSNDEMIARLAPSAKQSLVASGKLTKQQINAHVSKPTENLFDLMQADDQSHMYLPEVWQEAKNQWNESSAAQKEAKVREIQEDAQRVGLNGDNNPYPENYVIATIAFELNEEWLKSGRITEEQIRKYHSAREAAAMAADQQRAHELLHPNHPLVWREAANQWNAQTEEQKAKARHEIEQEVRRTTDPRMGEDGIVILFLVAVVTCFLPIYSPVCFLAGLAAAYRLGSHSLVSN